MHLVEIENGDFAVTMARQLIFSAYQFELYTALLTSTDPTLSALAAKAVKEVDYHRDHATQWVLRLGDGTAGIPRPDAGRPSTRSGPTSRKSSTPPTPQTFSLRCPASPPTRPRSARPGPTYVENVIAAGNTDPADPDMAVPRRPHRLPHREPGAPAAGHAEPAPFTPRSDLVTIAPDATMPTATGSAASR